MFSIQYWQNWIINSLYIVRRKGAKNDLGDLVVMDVLKLRMVRYNSKSTEDVESDTNEFES